MSARFFTRARSASCQPSASIAATGPSSSSAVSQYTPCTAPSPSQPSSWRTTVSRSAAASRPSTCTLSLRSRLASASPTPPPSEASTTRVPSPRCTPVGLHSGSAGRSTGTGTRRGIAFGGLDAAGQRGREGGCRDVHPPRISTPSSNAMPRTPSLMAAYQVRSPGAPRSPISPGSEAKSGVRREGHGRTGAPCAWRVCAAAARWPTRPGGGIHAASRARREPGGACTA